MTARFEKAPILQDPIGSELSLIDRHGRMETQENKDDILLSR